MGRAYHARHCPKPLSPPFPLFLAVLAHCPPPRAHPPGGGIATTSLFAAKPPLLCRLNGNVIYTQVRMTKLSIQLQAFDLHFLPTSRQRSPLWLASAFAGPAAWQHLNVLRCGVPQDRRTNDVCPPRPSAHLCPRALLSLPAASALASVGRRCGLVRRRRGQRQAPRVPPSSLAAQL